jgi:hypothetical protein
MTVGVKKWTTPFWVAVKKFYAFLLGHYFSSYFFRIERFCFSEIFSQSSGKPKWDDITEEHKDAPESYEEHDYEINRPKELIEWKK